MALYLIHSAEQLEEQSTAMSKALGRSCYKIKVYTSLLSINNVAFHENVIYIVMQNLHCVYNTLFLLAFELIHWEHIFAVE